MDSESFKKEEDMKFGGESGGGAREGNGGRKILYSYMKFSIKSSLSHILCRKLFINYSIDKENN